MPLNEIEEHPYLDYLRGNSNGSDRPWSHYTKLIIGSFPVYNITRTIQPIRLDRSTGVDVKMPFFYGSEGNRFWERLATTFRQRNPWLHDTPLRRKSSAISLLEDNQILLTDVIKKTNRHSAKDSYSPSDSSLFNLKASTGLKNQFELNTDIIGYLINGENIRSVYFTAQKCITGKTPGGWFHQLLNGGAVHLELINEGGNSLTYHITNELASVDREITLFFLPTPSAKRSIPLTANRQHTMFVTYLNSVDPAFLARLFAQQFVKTAIQRQTLANHREEFVRHWWQKYLVDEDDQFDGALVNN
jgi:hypothetical protein